MLYTRSRYFVANPTSCLDGHIQNVPALWTGTNGVERWCGSVDAEAGDDEILLVLVVRVGDGDAVFTGFEVVDLDELRALAVLLRREVNEVHVVVRLSPECAE